MIAVSSSVDQIQKVSSAVIAEVERAVLGKHEIISQAVLTLLCNGHLLIEDIPGVGKTTTAKALAKAIGGEFKRMQFTPDLLPADVTGAAIYDQKQGTFEFRPGPIFANVVLVDEINRATPKTQSALLEAMEERQVSVDGITRPLPSPSFVIATQNNIEMTGTYPLPEAQLDRFFSRISLGYPDREAESRMILERQSGDKLESLVAVTTLAELQEMQLAVKAIHVGDPVRHYIVDIVRSTREQALLMLGASPRGSLYLMRAAQCHAGMAGRDYVSPDDVKAVAPLVLAHRIISRGEVRARGTTNEQIIQQVMDAVPTPVSG
ncbi:MAG: MoxR family ATPase [Armatimonadetes bacterium]|nr:MoxR family ATPase [Armatimonadota bacterium]